MSLPSWAHVKELLHQALALEPEARARFLDEVCASNAALRVELESLLSVGDELNTGFLESPSPAKFGGEGEGFGAAGLAEGQLFAERFQLIRRLGEGGMGQVWLAEQTAPVRRPVALKLIKAGMYDETVVQRFQAERQSLAIMDHPAIAKVFDAGITPQGQPYFVMEYVQGLPITEYCDQQKLNIRERVELLIQACDGVQHAHQKAIIHRDLKPANILVVEVDGKPVPRIIDFGLAKAAAPETADHTMFTRFGQFLGTPGYMSPEQVDPNIQDIDTRTDVYSLGVILYVLLTGLQPFEKKHRQRPSLEEWLRQLREEEPPRPSGKVSEDRDTATDTSAARGTEPKLLASLLKGDLDWITMKALERDRERRYGTPAELVADLRRYLNDEPVTARPASAGYRIRKYISRHRVAAAVTTGLLLLMTAFSALQAIQLQKITQERDRANRERDRATRITDFMTGMFRVSDPSEARGNSITVREILDKASKDIDTGLSNDHEIQAQMMYVMGDVYENLGLYPRAQLLLQQAMEIRQRVLGREHPDTLRSASNLAYVLSSEGHYAEAEKSARETLEIQRRVLGPQHPDTLRSASNIAFFVYLEGHYDEAEKLARETLEIQRRVLGLEHPDTLTSMNKLATDLENQGHYADSEKLRREALDIERRVLGPEHPQTLRAQVDLAVILERETHYLESEKLAREALEIQRRLLGLEHPTTVTSIGILALDLEREGRYPEAEKLYRERIDLSRHVLGPEHPDTLLATRDLADILLDEHRYPEAEKLYREVLDVERRVLGPEHPHTTSSMDNLANVLLAEGHDVEAEKLYREALDIDRRVLGPECPDCASITYNLGSVAAHRGRRDEALSLLRDAVDHGLPPQADVDMDKDPDFKSLHTDPRFAALVAHAKERAAAAEKSK